MWCIFSTWIVNITHCSEHEYTKAKGTDLSSNPDLHISCCQNTELICSLSFYHISLQFSHWWCFLCFRIRKHLLIKFRKQPLRRADSRASCACCKGKHDEKQRKFPLWKLIRETSNLSFFWNLQFWSDFPSPIRRTSMVQHLLCFFHYERGVPGPCNTFVCV